jgi:hypothetical protein
MRIGIFQVRRGTPFCLVALVGVGEAEQGGPRCQNYQQVWERQAFKGGDELES